MSLKRRSGAKKRKSERKPSLAKQATALERDLIDRWLALSPDRRTNFLRVKTGIIGSAL